MSMTSIAIDIVLLPDENMMQQCIKINKAAQRQRFPLGTDDFVPHITLSLSCIDDKYLPQVIQIVQLIADKEKKKILTAQDIGHYVYKEGNRSFVKVKVTDTLQALHEKLTDSILQYTTKCENANVLVEGKITGISESTKKILNEYKNRGTKYSFENFNTHLSLGCYDAEKYVDESIFPFEFSAGTLALFHVGDGCTCRKLLWKQKLN